MGTTILTEAAFIALVPAGLVLYMVLDRYASPKVPETLFDEKNLLLAFVVGIPAGLPLTVIFLIYSDSLISGALISSIACLLLFVAVANLGRMIFLKIKRFAPEDPTNPNRIFNTFAFGCGTAVTIILGATNSGLTLGPALDVAILFSALSADVALLEGWAALRYAGSHTSMMWLYQVAGIEALALLAISPLYLGAGYFSLLTLLVLFVVLLYLLTGEDLRQLRPLLKPKPPEGSERPFGRVKEGPGSD